MIPPNLFYQRYLSFLEQNDSSLPNCGELSEYTDSAHTEVEDLSSRYMCMDVFFCVLFVIVFVIVLFCWFF